MTLDGLEFEDDEVDAVTLQEHLAELDRTIHRIRFDSPRLTHEEILVQLSQLMEDRNALYDRLRAARLAKFKADIQSLKVGALQLQPIFAQASRRCTLAIQDQRLTPPDPPPGKHKKKPKWRHPWFDARREFLGQRKAEVERMLAEFKSGKVLSTQDFVAQKRLQIELEGITAELKSE
jgi:hypothetical protein